MRAKLIEALDLKPVTGKTEVTNEQIVGAITQRSRINAAPGDDKFEAAIRDLISESVGALKRDGAMQVMIDRVLNEPQFR